MMYVFGNTVKKLRGMLVAVLCGVLLAVFEGPLLGAAADAAEMGDGLLDLVFVIDNSGSMKKNDPDFITPQVVHTFIGQLSLQTQVAMVLFDENARLLMPLTPLSESSARQSVEAGLKIIDYRGQHTNTPVGIERALYELRVKGRPAAQKGIIFITDGIVDTGDPRKDEELTRWLKQDLADQSRELGIRIFGIALTDAADFSLIQTLAARTQGEYFRTYAASEITAVFNQIQAHLTPEPAALPVQTTLPPVPPAPAAEIETSREAPPPAENMSPTQAEAGPAKGRAPVEKTVVVIEKGAWVMTITVVVVVIVLGAVLAIFFFYQYGKRKTSLTSEQVKTLNIPEAHLEDVDKICPTGDGLFKIDKERINIGRGKLNDIILEQPAVSGFHATIEFRNMSFYLEDQRSTNGTMLNDRRLSPNEPVRLKSGDRITFAKFHFKFIVANQRPFGDTIMLSMTALSDPEAEATIVLDLDGGDSKQGLIACMQNHLMQIYGLGPKYKDYINSYFAHDTLDVLATAAHENLRRTKSYQEQYCTPIIKNRTFYLVCSLPVAVSAAADWYGQRDNGFTQYVFKWLKSNQYQAAKCHQLCIVTFGQDPATWVSITIVPTHSEPDPVEIMSVDFLNEEEKSSLALDFDNHGRVI
jgi:pSer/pThr/pTyr-binding forkhead associated (FHA) protein/Mg-chelatase subunit ChlD